MISPRTKRNVPIRWLVLAIGVCLVVVLVWRSLAPVSSQGGAGSAVHVETALAFASALVASDFRRAHALLTPELRTELSPDLLRQKFQEMLAAYTDGELTGLRFDEQTSMTDWPAKESGDLGWAYVSISGETFSEGVAVVVADVDGAPLIRNLEWGRP
jgi:hypothetical protein